MCAQLRVIPKNKEQVCWSSCSGRAVFNCSSCKNKESKNQPFQMYFPVKLADENLAIKKEKSSSYLVYNIISFKKMTVKAEQFSWNIV